ncbi:MAG TPA: (2Fe-2S)-binding protein, partial [Acidimicrobiales bacterium]|nr:(2Fe-2S)-binding protein [Acidimicrobiales bacterium]
LIDATRTHIRVGKRLLLGNVAASSAVAFRTMEGCLGPWVQELGETFFRSCPTELRGLGSFLSLEHGDRRGWYWERTNCCLYDRLPGKARCADCSRTPSEDRRRAYWDSLKQS